VAYTISFGEHPKDILPCANDVLDSLRVKDVDSTRDPVCVREPFHLGNILPDGPETIATMPPSIGKYVFCAFGMAVVAFRWVPDVDACTPAGRSKIPFEAVDGEHEALDMECMYL